MGLHFDYMKKLAETQAKLLENNSTDGWSDRTIEDSRALACALLIKSADISNVVCISSRAQFVPNRCPCC